MAQFIWADGTVEKIYPSLRHVVTAHELARRLLEGPDLPVGTSANNHWYRSTDDGHGDLLCREVNGHIMIGNGL